MRKPANVTWQAWPRGHIRRIGGRTGRLTGCYATGNGTLVYSTPQWT